MIALLKSNRLLWCVMLFLYGAAVAVPLLMKQMPLPLRLVVGFTDLVAATSIALLLRQRKLVSKG